MQTDTANEYLRGLFEQYASVDCWCGYGFEDVIDTYVREPTDPADSDPADRERLRTLERTRAVSAQQRRQGLIADLDRLLSDDYDEASRRTAIVESGGQDVLEFSAFWTGTGDDCTSPSPAGEFLRLSLDSARNASNPEEPVPQ